MVLSAFLNFIAAEYTDAMSIEYESNVAIIFGVNFFNVIIIVVMKVRIASPHLHRARAVCAVRDRV